MRSPLLEAKELAGSLRSPLPRLGGGDRHVRPSHTPGVTRGRFEAKQTRLGGSRSRTPAHYADAECQGSSRVTSGAKIRRGQVATSHNGVLSPEKNWATHRALCVRSPFGQRIRAQSLALSFRCPRSLVSHVASSPAPRTGAPLTPQTPITTEKSVRRRVARTPHKTTAHPDGSQVGGRRRLSLSHAGDTRLRTGKTGGATGLAEAAQPVRACPKRNFAQPRQRYGALNPANVSSETES